MRESYKMIIVDDEFGIRESLCSLFEWEKLGYEIKGSFEEFDCALDYLCHNPVDVLLTDIRLGNQSGINLVREASKCRPQIASVLISAYSEFEYAREAITLNVFEYLLKPFSYSDIELCFNRLYGKLDSSTPGHSKDSECLKPSNAYYIDTIKSYIEEHLSKNLSLDSAAEHLSISPAYLSRYFKKHTGMKFIDYVTHMRVEKAKSLLSDPSVRLSSVFQKVGYHSKSHFYNVFCYYTGYTPANYRNSILTGDPIEERRGEKLESDKKFVDRYAEPSLQEGGFQTF